MRIPSRRLALALLLSALVHLLGIHVNALVYCLEQSVLAGGMLSGQY